MNTVNQLLPSSPPSEAPSWVQRSESQTILTEAFAPRVLVVSKVEIRWWPLFIYLASWVMESWDFSAVMFQHPFFLRIWRIRWGGSFFFKKKIIYSTASGLNCSMWYLHYIIQDLSLQPVGSAVVGQGLLLLSMVLVVPYSACGILAPWLGIEFVSPASQGRFLTT